MLTSEQITEHPHGFGGFAGRFLARVTGIEAAAQVNTYNSDDESVGDYLARNIATGGAFLTQLALPVTSEYVRRAHAFNRRDGFEDTFGNKIREIIYGPSAPELAIFIGMLEIAIKVGAPWSIPIINTIANAGFTTADIREK